MPITQMILVVLAVSSVAVADVFLKKTQVLGSMSKAILSPWMLGAVVLYLFQIFFFTYLFMNGAKLTHIGIMQTVLYALIVLSAGIFLFGETLTTLHIIGILFALTGVVFLNL